MSEWKEAPLGNLAETQLGKMLNQKKNAGEPRRYLGNDNVQWNSFKLDEVKEMRFKDSELDRFRLRHGDLLVCEGGDPGRCALWESDEEVYYQKALHRVRVGKELDARYLLYFLIHIGETQEIRQYYTGGATIKHLPAAALNRVVIRYPSYDTQGRIAGVLSAYDKLIENNRKQIKLLEEAAQRLHKEWFVDLRFPGHETTPIHNGIPEGWKRTTVGKICELIRDSSRPDDRNESTMYIGLEHMPKNSICLNMYGDVSSVTGSKLNFRKNDILFGKIRPYFHKVGFAQCNGVTSTDTLVMRAKPNCFGLLLEIVSSDAYVAYATATSKTGTKMPRADWNAMSAYELLEPSARVLAQFDGFVKQITDEIMNLSDQIVAAREARDRLLPKLMSGEIEV